MEKNLQCIKKSPLEVDFYFAKSTVQGTWSKWKSKWTYKAIYTQIDLFEEITIERIIEIQEKLNNRPRKDLILKHHYMFNQKVAFVIQLKVVTKKKKFGTIMIMMR
jgi:hypothetical protein